MNGFVITVLVAWACAMFSLGLMFGLDHPQHHTRTVTVQARIVQPG